MILLFFFVSGKVNCNNFELKYSCPANERKLTVTESYQCQSEICNQLRPYQFAGIEDGSFSGSGYDCRITSGEMPSDLAFYDVCYYGNIKCLIGGPCMCLCWRGLQSLDAAVYLVRSQNLAVGKTIVWFSFHFQRLSI